MRVAMMVYLLERGSDGRTAYERSRGNKYHEEFPFFGWFAHNLPLDRARGRANKLEPKLLNVVFLGSKFGANELVIATKQGVVRAAAVKPKTRRRRTASSVRLG